MAVLFDTTVLIDLLRGRPDAVARVRALRVRGDVPLTSPINVEEICRGLFIREHDAACHLFDGLRIVAIGRVEGERAGAWRQAYAEQGVALSQADCLIAACAISAAVPLATGNPKDFPMSGLDVQHWPVGS